MNYFNKYLKYKFKYLNKKMFGGTISHVSPDFIELFIVQLEALIKDNLKNINQSITVYCENIKKN